MGKLESKCPTYKINKALIIDCPSLNVVKKLIIIGNGKFEAIL